MLCSVTYMYLSGFSRNATAQRSDYMYTCTLLGVLSLSPPSAVGRTPSTPPSLDMTDLVHCTAHTVWLHGATPTPPVSIHTTCISIRVLAG